MHSGEKETRWACTHLSGTSSDYVRGYSCSHIQRGRGNPTCRGCCQGETVFTLTVTDVDQIARPDA